MGILNLPGRSGQPTVPGCRPRRYGASGRNFSKVINPLFLDLLTPCRRHTLTSKPSANRDSSCLCLNSRLIPS